MVDSRRGSCEFAALLMSRRHAQRHGEIWRDIERYERRVDKKTCRQENMSTHARVPLRDMRKSTQKPHAYNMTQNHREIYTLIPLMERNCTFMASRLHECVITVHKWMPNSTTVKHASFGKKRKRNMTKNGKFHAKNENDQTYPKRLTLIRNEEYTFLFWKPNLQT